jgi:hypothetical protein
MMFFWVAGVSAVVGIAAVASLFLVQKALFNEKVLAEKSKTASTLVKNNEVVEELQNQIRVLNTNNSLQGNMVPGETQPVQVVLDALPSGANSSAFGASLQSRFLQGEGIQLDSLNVDPVQDVEVTAYGDAMQSADTASSQGGEGEYQVRFNFVVSTTAGNTAALKDLLVRLERSIRPITLSNVIIEAQGERLALRADGHTYYQPARTVDLRDKVVTP